MSVYTVAIIKYVKEISMESIVLLNRFLALEASAGSGKTFNLVLRYLLLLFKGVDTKNIFALTFTDKAANEMYERVLYTLVTDSSFEKYLPHIKEYIDLSSDELLILRAKLAENFLRSNIKVMTYDSFFLMVLRRFSLYKGLSPDFKIVTKFSTDIIKLTFLNILDSNFRLGDFVKFNAEMNLKLNQILDIFNELYLKEKEFKYTPSELGYDIDDYKKDIFISYDKLKQSYSNVDLKVNATKALNRDNLDDILSLSLLKKESMSDVSGFKKIYIESSDLYLNELKDSIRNYFLADEYIKLDKFFKFFSDYKEARIKIYKRDEKLSFDDIKVTVYELLKDELNSSFLYFRLDSNISHILCDEFQDTDVVQIDIFKPIIEEFISTNDFKTFFFVGDKKQSIYRFRGSNDSTFDYTINQFDMKREFLDKNYRSSRSVVDFNNSLFKGKIEGYIEQNSINDRVGYIEVKEPVSSDRLVFSICDSVEYLYSCGANYNDIAILVYKHKESDQISEELELRGIPIVVGSSGSIFTHKAIKIIVSTFKYIYSNESIYKREAESYIGDDFDFTFDDKKDCQSLAKDIIDRFKLEVDTNLVDFFLLLSSYSSIVDFLFSLPIIDDVLTHSSKAGVHILTKHKSKGLEFKHVIVPDKFSSKGDSSKNPLIFNYDGVDLRSIHVNYKSSTRRLVDSNFDKLYSYEEKLSSKDDINLLYVALSRAEESLIIIPKDKASKFDILGISSTTLGRVTEESKESIKDNVEELEEFIYEEISYGKQDNFHIDSKSSSNFVELTFGIVTHSVLEYMDEFNYFSLEKSLNIVKNRELFKLSLDSFDDLDKRVKMLCDSSRFKDIIYGAKQTFKEVPIVYKGESYYIDLLLEFRDKFIVVDYKTGNINNKNFEQVKNYMTAVSSISKKSCLGYLVYLNSNSIDIKEVY